MQRAGFAFARSRHEESHSNVQQNGSSEQTNAQHWGSLQPGVRCESQQFPASDMPQLVAQRERAIVTQAPSHPNSQQLGSSRQTTSQHTGSSQKGSAWAWTQLLLQPEPHPIAPQQWSRASPTQVTSQVSSQQSGLMLHTTLQHVSSSHPALPCVRKQSPTQGHSRSEPAGGRQAERARLAHDESHSPTQHDGST
jgi:hypothetical protein